WTEERASRILPQGEVDLIPGQDTRGGLSENTTGRFHAYDPRRTWGQMAVDSQERINFDKLRRERLQRTQEQMKQDGLEVLLLFDGDNIRYATGLYDYGWRT